MSHITNIQGKVYRSWASFLQPSKNSSEMWVKPRRLRKTLIKEDGKTLKGEALDNKVVEM